MLGPLVGEGPSGGLPPSSAHVPIKDKTKSKNYGGLQILLFYCSKTVRTEVQFGVELAKLKVQDVFIYFQDVEF